MPIIVPAVSPEQIERIEPWFATLEQQVFELGLATAVESNDFAIEHRRPGTEFSRQAFCQRWERFELVTVPGDQSAFALIDVCQRPEPVPLDLEQPLWMGKCPRPADDGSGSSHMEPETKQPQDEHDRELAA
jgi:hypothetical protein